MSGYRPERTPRWLKLTVVAALAVAICAAALAYAGMTIWLVLTGGFEGWW